MKFLKSDKVFFHFFENILNGHLSTYVVPGSHFQSFYRISQWLPSKKFKNNRGPLRVEKCPFGSRFTRSTIDFNFSVLLFRGRSGIASDGAATLAFRCQLSHTHVYRFD